MINVDYIFYAGDYHGSLSMDEFERLSVFASAFLDDLTMGRIREDLPEETLRRVKLAHCAIVDAKSAAERRDGVAAESNDGISVTYAEPSAAAGARRFYEAAALYLAPTGLLYRGVG